MILEVGVKIFLKNKEGKILLLKRSPEKYGETSGRWDIPGGRIIPGSELVDNLKREVREETQLEIIEIPRFVYAQDIILPDSKKHVVRLSFEGRTLAGNKVVLNEEHTAYKWLSLKEIEHQEGLDRYVKEIVDNGIIK